MAECLLLQHSLHVCLKHFFFLFLNVHLTRLFCDVRLFVVGETKYALLADEGSFPVPAAHLLGATLFILGILLNLWTLHALGIKGMYNGDSFGWLMDAPVTTGPYIFFNDPQYVGTTAAMFGSALYYQSLSGVLLTAWMGVVFYVSVKFIEVLFFSLPEFEKYLFWYVDPPTIAYFLLFFLAFSLRFQGPHMSRLYSPAARKHNKLY